MHWLPVRPSLAPSLSTLCSCPSTSKVRENDLAHKNAPSPAIRDRCVLLRPLTVACLCHGEKMGALASARPARKFLQPVTEKPPPWPGLQKIVGQPLCQALVRARNKQQASRPALSGPLYKNPACGARRRSQPQARTVHGYYGALLLAQQTRARLISSAGKSTGASRSQPRQCTASMGHFCSAANTSATSKQRRRKHRQSNLWLAGHARQSAASRKMLLRRAGGPARLVCPGGGGGLRPPPAPELPAAYARQLKPRPLATSMPRPTAGVTSRPPSSRGGWAAAHPTLPGSASLTRP